MAKCTAFEVVARRDAHTLILGTLPGEESLKRGEYYAKKTNKFWQIMQELFGIPLDANYESRLQQLKKNGIALWDVCASADRSGSLDSKIILSTVIPNDFKTFFYTHKHIKLICFNGKFANKLYRCFVLPKLPSTVSAIHHEILPSTSPAHATLPFDMKLMCWRKIIDSPHRPS